MLPASKDPTQMDSLLLLVKSLLKRIEELERKVEELSRPPVICRMCRTPGHWTSACPTWGDSDTEYNSE
jgi:hypothetical protein